jgi:SET domain-containing protein
MKLADGLTIKKSPINGKGCFAARAFAKGRKIAEYAGERITTKEAERRAASRRVLRICAIDRRWSLDGARGGNGTHYINHSCRPNSYMLPRHD